MSLLNDALKRAKLEALERETEGRGDYGLPTPGGRGRRRSLVWPFVLIAGVVVLAGIGATLGWLLARAGSGGETAAGGGTERPTATSRAETPSAAEPTPSPQSAGAEDDRRVETTDRTSETRALGTGDPDMSTEETTPPETTPVEAAPVETNAVDTSPRQAGDSDSTTTPASPAGASTLTDGATYVRSLDVGALRLDLQGIAYQGGSSVAIINGLMVGPEDMIEGFRIIAIEPERVQLQGRGVTVYLALH